MASTQQHQRLVHDAEVTSGSEGLMSVRINSSNKPHKRQQQGPSSKPFKYSISSSCSSGEPGSRRGTVTALRDRRKFPPLFERSAARFWDPRFDSPILEEACQERCFPRTQRRLRYVLLYLATAGLLWGAYFGANGARCNLTAFLVPTAAFLLFCLLLFLFTFTRPYTQFHSEASLLLVAVTFALTLAPQMQAGVGALGGGNFSVIHATAPCISPVGTFSMCVEVLLLLYGVLHVRLFACVLLGLGYSALFEALGWMGLGLEALSWLAPAKVLLHLCAHAIGVHLFITSEARSRSTFLKVGQAVMHGKDLEVEKALKERMIHSVMPRRVADELMKQGDEEIENVAAAAAAASSSCSSSSSSSSPKNNKRKKTSILRGRIIFRPFNMKRMEHVSILFADIVGFTKMSANKSAPALVGLLNDLFGRFDRLCELTNCEKISTLGDCYYCVAGCPEPRSDHAYCCVEMGLGMIQAIERFCRETGETVDMRVGVHTGTVLCGILGMKRFKFDVWSNDVNLANLMEQLGMAGKVHLSEATASFLDDRYRCEDGRVAERVGQSVVADQLKGLKTYLISGRMIDHTECSCSQLGLTGLDTVDRLSPAPCIHDVNCCNAGDHATCTTPGESGVLCGPHKAKWPCVACKAVDRIPEEGAVQNGGQDECRSHSDKVSLGQSPKGLNGLLSPPSQEEAVTNSQTSLCEILEDKDKFSAGGGGDHSTLIPNRSKGFRMKNDAHFVEVIKEDSLMNDYFFNPPINKLSLNFLEKSLESAYRTSYQEEVETQADVQTFASPTFSTFLDVSLSCAIFLALTLACFLRPLVIGEPPPATAVAFAVLAGLLGGISLALSIRMAFYMDSTLSFTWMLLRTASGWVPRHMIGAVLVSLPAMSVFTHVTCSQHLPVQFATFLCCAVAIAIVQYSNFCQLSFWMRSCLATIVGAVLLFLLYSPLCREKPSNLTEIGIELDSTPELKPAWAPLVQDLLGLEVVLAFFLLLLLVWFLNRDFEVGYRLHYHGNVEADRHRIKIQNMRDQADWLLGNIIPLHVADQLKVTQSYSKNHDDVGVIFASIVNFSEFYEESYEGGKECYRVLNELIGDFDELLRRPPFRHVEKIKTIGATYMAASGLDAQQRRDPADPHAHLRALFDFALEMMRVVEDFNKNMLGFQFKLRVGFNHGPLTAGVIGTTKLLYDIWGDTVNIASRMDTTGVECCVQVSEGSSAALSQLGYDLEYRGTVNVKGKGQMRTFLFLGTAQGGASPRHSTGNALETPEGRKVAIMGPGLVQEVSVAGTGPVFTCPEPHKSLQRQEKEEANELTKLKVVEDL